MIFYLAFDQTSASTIFLPGKDCLMISLYTLLLKEDYYIPTELPEEKQTKLRKCNFIELF
jgi:hypothetical protein